MKICEFKLENVDYEEYHFVSNTRNILWSMIIQQFRDYAVDRDILYAGVVPLWLSKARK